MVLSMKSVLAMAACASSIASATSVVEFDLKKHIGTINSKSVVSKDGSGILSFDLLNQQSFFSVDVQIGTPAQSPVVLLIDTGSSDMWVNGADACLPGTYSNISSNSAQKQKRYTSSVLQGFELTATYASTYFDAVSSDFIEPSATTGSSATSDPTVVEGIDCSEYGAFSTGLSSTWKELDLGEPFSIEYVDLSQADGVYGTDSLSINGVSVSGVTFAVATFSNSTQGVLGISLPRDESLFTNYNNGSVYNNLPAQLKADGLIAKNSYSLFLNSLCDQSGSLLFGAINSDWYTGELNTVPLVNIYPHFSETPIEFDITVNGVGIADYPTLGEKKTVTKTNFPGVLDSGTTLMQLPPDLAFALADSFDFVFNEDFGWFVGGCPSDQQLRESSIVFNIGGINYYAPLNNFIYTTSSPDVCAFVVSPYTSGGSFEDPSTYSKYNNYAILGDVLLTSVVAIYDLESYEITLGVANYEGYAAGLGEVEQIISTVPNAKQAPGYSNTWSTWEYITHYTGDESDGIFTNAAEVNPWLATSSFGCSMDSITVPTSVTATSSVSSTSSYNSTFVTPNSSNFTSSTETSIGSSSFTTSDSSSSLISTATSSKQTLTVITITSCKNDDCSLVPSSAMLSVATITTENTIFEYTTYCPLTDSEVSTSFDIAPLQDNSVSSSFSSFISTESVSSTKLLSASVSSTELLSASVSSTELLTASVSSTAVLSASISSNSTSKSVLSTESNAGSKQVEGSLIALLAGLLAVI